MRFLRLFGLEEGDVSDCLEQRLGPLYPLFWESGPDEKASSSRSNVKDVDNVLLSSSPQSVNSEGISWEGFRDFDSDSELDLDLQSLFARILLLHGRDLFPSSRCILMSLSSRFGLVSILVSRLVSTLRLASTFFSGVLGLDRDCDLDLDFDLDLECLFGGTLKCFDLLTLLGVSALSQCIIVLRS